MKLKTLAIILTALIFVGCASIPPEAPDLSIELGKRISAIETSNIKLLIKFFDQKREVVDTFVQEEWVPSFAEDFFKNKNIADAWNVIVKEDDKEQRLQFLIIVGSKLQAKINAKRLELIKPLDELERSIEKALQKEYSQAKAINNSISSFLLSASEVAENRNRYLEMLGVSDEKIAKAIDKTDEIVSKLLKQGKDAPKKVEKAEKFINKVKSLRDSI
ncbi:MAG: hypothetical protein GQ474_07055 [Sulfurimonas sp.]|nr:hypothetical protein [Sulfurimonas sp.]